jgi:hypothetical protein
MRPFLAPILAATVAAVTLAGCARPSPNTFEPAYGSRAVKRSEGAVQISAATLSADESRAVYGVALADQGIQPVWIEVHNGDDRSYFLLSPGVDPHFFPPSEVAETFADTASQNALATLDLRFSELAFHNPVRPGETASGFVLTHLDEGMKFVQVDLVASEQAKTASLFTVVPGFQADYKASRVFSQDLYARGTIENYTDDDAFGAALEALPCCATNKDGTENGDPLNLVIVGGLDDAFPALVRRGWAPTEEKWSGAIMKMVTSFLAGKPYVNAPVSDLYLFGRPQDLALQTARDTIHERNHLRLWLGPMRYHNKPVWIGQISRDIGIRFTTRSPTLTTHKIDPDVDEARAALTEDMAYSQNLVKIGAVKGSAAAAQATPKENLTGDPYYSDGLRVVLVFDQYPTSLSGIAFFQWSEGNDGHGAIPGAGR